MFVKSTKYPGSNFKYKLNFLFLTKFIEAKAKQLSVAGSTF